MPVWVLRRVVCGKQFRFGRTLFNRMQSYHELLERLLREGTPKTDRTGTGTRSLFGIQLRYSLSDGFPLLTTKKVHFKSILHELLWFIRGETNVGYLRENGITIWDEWADSEGNLGPVYGAQWRSWPAADGTTIDQLAQVVDQLRTAPNSRRILVNAWNVGLLPQMALPPCHLLFQFYVAQGQLSVQVYQRSCDVFLGLPFNIASYALLLQMVAQVTGHRAHEVIMALGDTHLYTNHIQQAKEQLTRNHLPLPAVQLNPAIEELWDFRAQDIRLENYHPHPAIKAPVAV